MHDYQKQAIRFALKAFASPSHGCGLFLEPGLGKTLTSIAVMDIMHAADPHARFLVIAPALVARNSWPDALDRWKGIPSLPWAVAGGTPPPRSPTRAPGADGTGHGRGNP
ncbi:SNF2-related protein, partial [Bifidobacterium longum]|uniref:SNF2-related protein n=1 Tax=Bifidobacterium longum TaxID=216816 RepID=UPI001F544ECA